MKYVCIRRLLEKSSIQIYMILQHYQIVVDVDRLAFSAHKVAAMLLVDEMTNGMERMIIQM